MLNVTQKIIDAIIAQAKNEFPLEACGYLAAENDIVITHFPMTNIDKARDHFSMDPNEQFQAVKSMRDTGLDLKAIYHSHPDTPARPSIEDLKLAYDSDVSYVIISLADPEPVIKSFLINNGKAIPEEIQVLQQD